MSVTIATLPYESGAPILRTYLKDAYSWFWDISVVDGYKGKATITDYRTQTTLLKVADCDLDNENLDVIGKDVDIKDYNFSIPVKRCDLRQTWLSAFAEKYKDVEEIFMENLMPYVAEKVAVEVRGDITTDFLAEAKLDTVVQKIVAPAITDEATAFAGIKSFITAFSADFLTKATDISWLDKPYYIYVSPQTYTRAALHLSDKVDRTVSVGGFVVLPDRALTGSQMYCTYPKNILGIFDDTSDINRFKVVPKEYENKDYIVGGISFTGSYTDSKDIVITDNF